MAISDVKDPNNPLQDPNAQVPGVASQGSGAPGDVPFGAGQGNSPDTLKAINDSLTKAGLGAGQTPAPPPQNGWDSKRVTDYFKSKGVTPFDSSPDYWVQKWNEWGSKDPAYFQQRLDQADEFTGKGKNYNWQAAGVPNPGTSSPPTGGTGSPSSGPSLGSPSQFWSGRSPLEIYQQSSQIPGQPLAQQSTGLLQQLMSRIGLQPSGLGFKG